VNTSASVAKRQWVRRIPIVFGLLGLLAIGPAVSADAQSPAAEPPSSAAKVELVALRSEYGKVFRASDGTLTAEIFTRPQHYKTSDGGWAPVDASLTTTGGSFAWRNVGGPLQLRFAEVSRADGTVEVSVAGGSVSFGIGGAASPSFARVEEKRVTYPSVHPGVDIVYESRDDALKESIVLHEAPERELVFRFNLALQGLTPRLEADGSISFVGSDGKVALMMPAASMVDSSLDAHAAEPAFSEDIVLELVKDGAGFDLLLRPSLRWLQDPKRVYPVEIDPTVTRGVTLDTFVQTGITSGQSASDELKSGTFDGGATKARSLIRFDLTGLTGKEILSATMSLYEWHSWSCTNSQVNAARVTESWGAGANWSNQPAATSAFDTVNDAKGFSASCPDGRLNFDATTPVTNWTNGSVPNHGVRIRADDESNNNGWKKFRSEDFGGATTDPKLEVTYNSYPTAVSGRTPAANTISSDATPILSANYNDPDDGDVGHVDYEICDAAGCPSGSVVSSGSGTLGVQPGDPSPWEVPAGVLTSGQSYWWHARSDDGRPTKGPWSTAIAYIPDLGPEPPTLLAPAAGLVTTLTPTLSAVYEDADPGDVGHVHFEVYDSSSVLVAQGDGNDVKPGQRSSWVVSVPLQDNATYTWRAWSEDDFEQSTVVFHDPVLVKAGGDVYHAEVYTDDPGLGAEPVYEEWARINTLIGRYEDQEVVITRDSGLCDLGVPLGPRCDEVRGHTKYSEENPALTEGFWSYTGFENDLGLDQVTSLLAPANEGAADPIATGPIQNAIESWQVLPADHAAEYEFVDITDEMEGLRVERWIDSRTKLPLKQISYDSTDTVLGTLYWTYLDGRVDVSQLPSDHFRVPRPTNVGFEDVTQILGDETIGVVADQETSTIFRPFYLGPTATVTDSSGLDLDLCLAEIAIVHQSLTDPGAQVVTDPDPEYEPDPYGPQTYVSASYYAIDDVRNCTPGAPTADASIVEVMSMAAGSSMADAYELTYVDGAEAVQSDPTHADYDRAGVASVPFDTQSVTGYVVPVGDDTTSAFVTSQGPYVTTVVIDGPFEKATIDDATIQLIER
jgi:hypothetical protein